ncbi:MAG: hypothetical protein ACLP9L_23405 [Thermoguttaceae bacterium]
MQCIPTGTVGTSWEVEQAMRKSSQFGLARNRRRGLATLDYVLVLGVILPLAAFLFRVGPKIICLAYEIVCGIVSWPFM